MTRICVLGSYGEFVGSYIAEECLKRSGIETFILVRSGYDLHPEKKTKVDKLVSLGAKIVFGDANDIETLKFAFREVDIVISALGGWEDVEKYHHNVYEACKTIPSIKRIVPAQFGVDILSLPEEKMDNYMKKKRSWNLEGINSGIPYTIVSQGIFSQWILTMPNNPIIHHDTRVVDFCEDPDVKGCITTTLEDTARFTVDCALDPEMANRRVSIIGSHISAREIAMAMSQATHQQYTLNRKRTLAEIQEAKSQVQTKEDAFMDYILENWAQEVFTAGFEPPFLIDIPSRYGWTPESFEQAALRLLK